MINKEKLDNYINLYIEALKRDWWKREKYKWEAVKCFQDNWNIDDKDFVSMLKKSIKVTDNLLNSSGHLAGSMLIDLAKLDSDRAKRMFIYLFDENKELKDRIEFFKKEADSLTIQLQKQYPGAKNSYQDENAISVYLWLKYPNKYYIYKFSVCRKVSEILESDFSIKKGDYDNNINNSFNLYDEICSCIKEKENLKALLNSLKDDSCYYDDELKTATIDIGYFIYSKTKTDYLVSIIKALKNLGGQAHLSKIYSEVLSIRREENKKINSSHEATIRDYLERHSSDSTKWTRQDKDDIFKQVPEKGKGWWALRDFNTKEQEDLINDDNINDTQIKDNLNYEKQPLNQILYGPPGTGKTYNTVIKAMEIIDPTDDYKNIDDNKYKELKNKFDEFKKSGQIEFITFHQSYSYEEFIEGIKPIVDGSNKDLKYEIANGIFKELCLEANKDIENKYVLVIDEINRGNISKIFGELITLIEDDKRVEPNVEDDFENTQVKDNELLVTLPYSKQKFGVPKNLYIIGTMNTSDRSIASVDIALRRRFKFIEMMPKNDLVANFGVGFDKIFEELNNKIRILLDRDHQIGHSYFINTKYNDNNGNNNVETLKGIWFSEILPLLNEYFYNDCDKLNLIVPGFIKELEIPKCLKNEYEKAYEFKTLKDFDNNNKDFEKALLEEPKDNNNEQ